MHVFTPRQKEILHDYDELPPKHLDLDEMSVDHWDCQLQTKSSWLPIVYRVDTASSFPMASFCRVQSLFRANDENFLHHASLPLFLLRERSSQSSSSTINYSSPIVVVVKYVLVTVITRILSDESIRFAYLEKIQAILGRVKGFGGYMLFNGWH